MRGMRTAIVARFYCGFRAQSAVERRAWAAREKRGLPPIAPAYCPLCGSTTQRATGKAAFPAEQSVRLSRSFVQLLPLLLHQDKLPVHLDEAGVRMDFASIQLDSVFIQFIPEQSVLIHERNGVVPERNGVVPERNRLFVQRNALFLERNWLISEQNALISAQNGLVPEGSAVIPEENGVIRTKTTSMMVHAIPIRRTTWEVNRWVRP